MNFILNKLKIENFKGITRLDIIFSELHSEITGSNGTGKSTIYDAYIWLLFDKNAAGEKDFSIKPRQETGEEKHYQNIRVWGEFELDGKILQLEKIYTEIWTKKRGSEVQEYSGNTTEYYINAVPKKAGEYKSYIASLINEEKFKMITSAKYFNESMSWQERRKLLFEMANENTETDILNQYNSSSDNNIIGAIQGLAPEDALKMYQSQINKLNADLDKIPVRIDEASRMSYNTETIDESKTKSDINDIQELINNIDRQIVEKRNFQSETDTKIREISRLKVKITEREFELNSADIQKDVKMSRLRNAAETCENFIKNSENNTGDNNRVIANAETELDNLRKQYSNEADKPLYIDENALVCITCGQDLPADMKAAGLDKLKADFESDKTKKLADIKRRADFLKSNIDIAKKAIEKNNIFVEEQRAEIKKANEEISHLHKEKSEPVKVESDSIIINLKADIEKRQSEMDNIPAETADTLIKEKSALMSELTRLNEALGRNEKIKESRERVDELKSNEKDLAQQLLDIRHKLHIVEDYIKFKCEHIAGSINKLFVNAKFKLFDDLINGGISETCECLIDGVPYDDANNGAKINTGLEIADVLSGHFNFNAPIFIDNAESVDELYETDSQTIKLSVSKSRAAHLTIDYGQITEQIIKPRIFKKKKRGAA